MAVASAVGEETARRALAVVTKMGTVDLELSRISKFVIDRDKVSAAAALRRRQEFTVALHCGDDVAASSVLQIAVLTAASIATRCFPGAVRTIISKKLATAPLLLWPHLKLTFGEAVCEILGATGLEEPDRTARQHTLIFGDAPADDGALRVTFDGWIAQVGPARTLRRMAERPYFSATGVLAASLALSELFLTFGEISIVATRRVIGLSLWRPDLGIHDAEALGIPVEFLPGDLWVLGLGHLGNAYLWTLATLPYADPAMAEFALLDFDKVEKDNVETSVVLTMDDLRRFKTRGCSAWLERRGFQTRLVERRFDAMFRLQDKDPNNREPALALCGFDSNPARRDLPSANFRSVIESGLGGTANNYDTVSVHTLPNPRSPKELWPDLSREQERKIAEDRDRVARENPGYVQLGGDDCGRRELAGKSVAVPFVGTTAACLVVAEAIRLLHEGPAYFDIKLSLGDLGKRCRRRDENLNYTAADAAGLTFVTAKGCSASNGKEST